MRFTSIKKYWFSSLLLAALSCAGGGDGGQQSEKQGASTSGTSAPQSSNEEGALVVPANLPCQCDQLIDDASRGLFVNVSNPQSEKQHHCTFVQAGGSNLYLAISVVKANQSQTYKWVLESAKRGYKSLDQKVTEDLGQGSELQSFIATGAKNKALVHVVNAHKDGLIIEATELLDSAASPSSHPAYIDSLIANAKASCEE